MAIKGNFFNAGRYAGITAYGLTNSYPKCAQSFIARTALGVQLYEVYGTVSGTSPLYRIGLQLDNAGKPDGTFLNQQTFTPTGTSAHWTQVNTPTYTLTIGVKYWIVIEYVSGTINGSNCLNVYGTEAYDTKNTYNLEEYGQGFRKYTTSWQNLENNNASIVVDDANNCAEGMPLLVMDGAYSYGNYRQAQLISYPETIILLTLSLSAYKSGSPPADLSYRICLFSDKSVLQSDVFCTAAVLTTSPQKITKTLSTPVTLLANTMYMLDFYTSGGSYSNSYIFIRTLSGIQAKDSQSYYGATIHMLTSANAGVSYSNSMQYDLIFDFTLGAAASPPAFFPKKSAFSGFHCFIEQAINNFKLNTPAIKNPNNNEVF